MDIKIWLKTSFSEEKIPEWNCPLCEKGLLEIEKKLFFFEETEQSKKWHHEDDWEPEFIRYRFHGALKCKHCKEQIQFLGTGNVEVNFYNDPIYDYQETYENIFYPVYFLPALNLFSIPENCSDDICREILDSFKLFWSDLSSCANKIRVALELLMDHQKVKKFTISKGKRKRIVLHNRLLEYKKSRPDVADYLLAIKWIGNIGSHPGKLEKIDILEAFELLEHSLNKLFDDKEQKLTKLSKEIIKRKGKRKR